MASKHKHKFRIVSKRPRVAFFYGGRELPTIIQLGPKVFFFRILSEGK